MNRRLVIVAIIATLAAVGACTLLFNPGKFGMAPAGEVRDGW